MAARTPRVVAELGRPETSQETADRKAESSRLYRVRKTPSNLVWALLVSLGVVLVMVMITPRPASASSSIKAGKAGGNEVVADDDTNVCSVGAGKYTARKAARPTVPRGRKGTTRRGRMPRPAGI